VLLYIVNILDRQNVGFARLRMLQDLGISEGAYALGAGVFFISYAALGVPSNLILSRTGARRWIAAIMVSWGLISAAMLLVSGPWSFTLLRLLLGCAEAGFFPGILLYLTYWFPARERARAVALFMLASPLAGIVGGPLAGALLQFADGLGGLAGWQWLFLLEGIPAVLLGVVVLFYLTDRPDQASWLSEEQRSLLATQLSRDLGRARKVDCKELPERLEHFDHDIDKGDLMADVAKGLANVVPADRTDNDNDRPDLAAQPGHLANLWQLVADGRVWLLAALFCAIGAGISGLGYYLPLFIELRFPDYGQLAIGLLAAVPSLCTMIAMVAIAAHSDRTGERRWHVAGPVFLAALGWGLYAWVEAPLPSLLSLTLAHLGMASALPPFWSLATSYLSARTAAGGIAMINAVGNLGGFVGPNVIGQFQSGTADFTPRLLVMALMLIGSGALALCASADRRFQPPGH